MRVSISRILDIFWPRKYNLLINFKFAVSDVRYFAFFQDDCATRQFAAARLNKATAKELVQQQRSNDAAIASALRRDRQRQEAQQNAREQRFRVVNCLRTTLEDQPTEDGAGLNQNQDSQTGKGHITIVDIESQQQQQQQSTGTGDGSVDLQRDAESNLDQQQPADSDVGYVYDLYVPENEMQAAYVDMMDDNYLRFVIHIEPQQTFSLTNYYM